jgi:hypothetical protein
MYPDGALLVESTVSSHVGQCVFTRIAGKD